VQRAPEPLAQAAEDEHQRKERQLEQHGDRRREEQRHQHRDEEQARRLDGLSGQ
jgi:hypothetical protein